MPEEEVIDRPAAADEGVQVEVEKEKPPLLSDEEVAKRTEVPDDEIQRYADEAQKRIKGLRQAFQVERKKAEQWSRDASTASNLAEQLYRENQQLKNNVSRSETALVDQAIARSEAELEGTKNKYKQALLSQDADLIVAANEDVARAVAEVERLKMLKPTAAAAARERAQEQQAPPPAPATPRTQQWINDNPWFTSDPRMHDYAMAQHAHLLIDGITEASNPDLYFRTIEDRVKKQFPDKFPDARPTEGRARPVAVTGGTRSETNGSSPPGGKRVVRLTESQVRLSKRLGLTVEQYAKQLVDEEAEAEREKRSNIQ